MILTSSFKKQLATLFSNEEGLKSVKSKNNAKLKPKQSIMTLEELNAQKSDEENDKQDTSRPLNKIPANQQTLRSTIQAESFEALKGNGMISNITRNNKFEEDREENSQESEDDDDKNGKISDNDKVLDDDISKFIFISGLFKNILHTIKNYIFRVSESKIQSYNSILIALINRKFSSVYQ